MQHKSTGRDAEAVTFRACVPGEPESLYCDKYATASATCEYLAKEDARAAGGGREGRGRICMCMRLVLCVADALLCAHYKMYIDARKRARKA